MILQLILANLKRQIALLCGNSRNSLLIKGAIGTLLISILGKGVAFGTQVFLARVLGVEQYGIYVYVIEWVTFLTLFTSFGLDTTLLRFVSAYKVEEAWGSLRGVVHWSNKLALGFSLGVGTLGFVVIFLIKARVDQDTFNTFLLGWSILPFFTAIKLSQAVLRSLKKVILAQLLESMLRPLLLVLSVIIGVWGLAQTINSQLAMLLNALAYIGTFIMGFIWMYHALPLQTKTSTPKFQAPEWLQVTIPLFFIAGANMLFRQTDKLMVGMFLGTTAAGIYAICNRIAVLLMFGLNAVNVIVAPMISELFVKKEMLALQKTITLAAVGIFLFTVPLAMLMIIFGDMLLNLFGSEFLVGYTALVILIIGQVINALAGSVGFLMTMTGHQNRAAQISGGVAVLNVVLNVMLIPVFGIEGAAIATAISISLWNILLFLYVEKYIGIDPTIFSVIRLRYR